jgi:hypothetical protein
MDRQCRTPWSRVSDRFVNPCFVSTLAHFVPHSTEVLDAPSKEQPAGLNGFSGNVMGKGRVGSGTLFLLFIASHPAPGARKIVGKFLIRSPPFLTVPTSA